MEWRCDGYLVSDDKSLLDLEAVHRFLTKAYWAEGRTLACVQASAEASLCFGLYTEGVQIGFSRVITDHATFAYLCDVYVLEDFRGSGLGRFMMDCVFSHPRLARLKWLLKTTNAESLYAGFGFREIDSTKGWMIRRPSR